MKIKRFKNYITWEDKKGNFNTECNRASLENDIALTIPTFNLTKVALCGGGACKMSENLRIRKLTELECLKLMGFTQNDWEKINKQFSPSAIYYVAGNSIVTTCISSIFGSMTNVDYDKANREYVETLKGDYCET